MTSANELLEHWRKVQEQHAVVAELVNLQYEDVAGIQWLRSALVDLETFVREFREAV